MATYECEKKRVIADDHAAMVFKNTFRAPVSSYAVAIIIEDQHHLVDNRRERKARMGGLLPRHNRLFLIVKKKEVQLYSS